MLRRRVLVAVLLLLGACLPATSAAATSPVRVTASLDPDARLGSPTSLSFGVQIDLADNGSPVVETRLLYPAALGFATSGLGVESCRRPASDFVDVMIGGRGLSGCPPNSVLGRGSARAEVRLGDLVIPEAATVTMLSAPVRRGRQGLVVLAVGRTPFGAKLAYTGEVLPAAAPFGGAFSLKVPPGIPAVPEVTLALTEMQFTIGGDDIVYRERVGGRTVAYRPEGIALPNRCPRGGFLFQAVMRFQNGKQLVTSTRAPCPSR